LDFEFTLIHALHIHVHNVDCLVASFLHAVFTAPAYLMSGFSEIFTGARLVIFTASHVSAMSVFAAVEPCEAGHCQTTLQHFQLINFLLQVITMGYFIFC